jgi:hypothetical protein
VKKSEVPNTFQGLADAVKAGKYKGKLSSYAIDNTFGYAGFYGLVQAKGSSVLDTLGPATRPAADGGAMVSAVAQIPPLSLGAGGGEADGVRAGIVDVG